MPRRRAHIGAEACRPIKPGGLEEQGGRAGEPTGWTARATGSVSTKVKPPCSLTGQKILRGPVGA